MTRIATFVFGAGELSPYGRLLSRWAKDREEVTLFTDNPQTSKGHHYLRFVLLHAEQPFDILLFDIDDTSAHAVAFPIIAKHPGILFCNDIELWNFAKAVSHEPRDGWGTGWIFNVAAPGREEALAILAERGIDPGHALETSPLASALALRSAGVVVPDWDWERRLTRGRRLPPIGIIDDSISDGEFAGILERSPQSWQEWTGHMREVLEPVQHPFHDLYEVERERVKERYGGEPREVLSKALENLRDLFVGATNSTSAQRRKSE